MTDTTPESAPVPGRPPVAVPTMGRFVHYTLTQYDVDRINRNRRERGDAGLPVAANGCKAGDTFTALVVRVWSNTGAANLQVFLDGEDVLWATSATPGEPGQEGRWIWPPRV